VSDSQFHSDTAGQESIIAYLPQSARTALTRERLASLRAIAELERELAEAVRLLRRWGEGNYNDRPHEETNEFLARYPELP